MIQNFKLGDLFEIQLGKTPARGNKKMWDLNKKSNNIWLSIKDMSQADANGYVSDSAEYISDNGAKLVKLIPKNTLLLSFKLTLGRTAITKIPLRTNEAIAALLPKTDQCNIRYLKYYFEFFDFVKFASNDFKVKGLTLNKKKLADIPIPMPPLKEQEKIVERLDNVFEKINIDLSTTKKMIENNDYLEQSRIDYLFKSISDKSDKFKLSELGELITGNTPSTQEKDNYGNAVPFIKPGDFNQDGSLNYDNQGLSKKGKLKARLVSKNSVLMVCIGATIGKVGITSKEITTNQQINSIAPCNKIDSNFLYYQMLTTKFQKLVLDSSSQATLPIINKKKWGQIIVDVPTKDIQKESSKALDHLIFLNKELNAKFKLKIKLLKELKKSILIKEFSYE